MSEDRNEKPNERAPLLLVWGDLAPRVAALVRARPPLVARLIVAPREAVHATAAYLHLAPDAARPDTEVAAAIDGVDPRGLLRAALPGCPPRLYRALDRAGDRVRPRAFYARLGAVCRGPFADALLGGGALDEARLGFFEALGAMDPATAALRAALPESTFHAESVDALVAFLRARGALREADVRLPPRAGLPAVVRRLRAALGRIEAPDPGFAAPAPFRLLRTTDDLQRAGKALGNCVALPRWNAAQHHFRLLDGRGAYLLADEPRMLAALRRVAGGVWVLEGLAGPGNAAPPAGARAALLRDLRAAGLRIAATDPRSALSRLASEAARRRAPPGGNGGDGIDGGDGDGDGDGPDGIDDEDDDDLDGIAA